MALIRRGGSRRLVWAAWMAAACAGCNSTFAPARDGVGGSGTGDAQRSGVGGAPGVGGASGIGGAAGAGVCMHSYRDALAPAPAAHIPPSSLGPGDGVAHASCRALLDNGSTSTSVTNTEIVSAPAHAGGRYYYEATVRVFVSGWTSIGVFAPPDTAQDGPFAVGDPGMANASAAVNPLGLGIVGVAADVDAGVVFFFADGQLVNQRTLSLLPGVGAYSPGIVSMVGNAIDVNFGQTPFMFAVPAGYAAWASHLGIDAAGQCVGDVAAPTPGAPITGVCDAPAPSTFSSACGGGLVALGIYTTDSANSDHHEGTTLVHVKRQGHTTLGLSAYEPTHWIIDVGPGAIVDRVIAYGFYMPRVDAPGGAVVTISGDQIVGGMQWPFDDGGDDTQGYIARLEHDAGAPLTMFGGCYAATELTVGD